MGIETIFSTLCLSVVSPIPGDDIFGFMLLVNEGIKVHQNQL